MVETVKTAQSDISYINRRPVLRLRDEIIPVINLGKVLGRRTGSLTLAEKPYVVVVGLADQKLGINIDRFLGQEEVVIKSLGSYLGTTDGVAGATILGDGRIRLIIDLHRSLQSGQEKGVSRVSLWRPLILHNDHQDPGGG